MNSLHKGPVTRNAFPCYNVIIHDVCGLLQDGPFVWDKSVQGHVLGSFFYGYLVSQIPAGMLAEAFSCKWVFFIFTGLSTLATLFTPLAAQAGWPVLVVLRILAGIGSVGVLGMMTHYNDVIMSTMAS